ncbi:meiotic nuclear division protein 1 [Entophlyctis helioformis]|nr:meiotic nuclear division protein 1 [Entophlyctis helioformis]
MSRRAKPLSLEEKRKRMVDLFHETRDFMQLRELEKIAPKQKGIIEKSVKEVLDGLVADGLVQTEKIGTSNYYWAYPGSAAHQIRARLDKAKRDLAELQEKEVQVAAAIDEATAARQDTEERRRLLGEFDAAQASMDKLKAEVAKFKDRDPVVLRAKEQGIKVAVSAVNRWTDNIYTLQSYCRNTFGISSADFSAQFNVPDDLEYIDSC